jgi:serine/threonine protein kinase
MSSSSSNVVGVHYRVGKKIGEGSFGVIFEGTNLLNNQQVAIKFVCLSYLTRMPMCAEHRGVGTSCDSLALKELILIVVVHRNPERAMLPNYETSIEHTRSWWAAVSISYFLLVASN